MLFSSLKFLFYFLPVFLLVYVSVPQRFRNGIALFGSLLFYALGAPKFFLVLVGSSFVDFLIGRKLAPGSDPMRKLWLTGGIVLNVSLLTYFKYANFFVEQVQGLLGSTSGWIDIALPIGISFFTFQKISFLIDTYRGTSKSFNRFDHYLLYVMLFPQLIAGPIVRFHEVADQIRSRPETSDQRLQGLFRFTVGLGRKVLIANVLGAQADLAFGADPLSLSGGDAWLGLVSYTLQIYFDFAGYSDMAIGLGLMMGFRFPENFNFPYIATSITEFWHRWHLTLSRWMRDYLYIPLGGNRVTPGKVYRNLWIVFLLSGLWHGAAWNFVIWGAFHGFFLVAERILPKAENPMWKPFGLLYAFITVMIGWVFFRAENLELAIGYLEALSRFESIGVLSKVPGPRFWFTLGIGLLTAFMGLIPGLQRWVNRPLKPLNSPIMIVGMVVVILSLLVLSAGEIAASGFNPFIYFQF